MIVAAVAESETRVCLPSHCRPRTLACVRVCDRAPVHLAAPQDKVRSDCAGAGDGWVALRGRGASTGFEDCNVYPYPPAGIGAAAARAVTRPGAGSEALCWRCYSPSTLNANKTQYVGGSAYCTRNDEIQTALTTCTLPQPPDQGPFSQATEVSFVCLCAYTCVCTCARLLATNQRPGSHLAQGAGAGARVPGSPPTHQ